MSKVVLLAINAKYVHTSLSVRCLSAGISRHARMAHDVEVVEATINQQNEEIATSVAAHRPDVVGISTYIWNASMLPKLLKLLREWLPDAVFVMGGPEAAHNVKHWLFHGVEYIIRGESEHSFPALLDMLAGDNTTSLESISGLTWRQDRETHNNPVINPPDEWINPYDDAYFDTLGGRIAYVETSRGCPFQCAFCLSGGSGVRFLPMDTAKEQLCKLSNSGAKTIKLVDRTFNCNAERAYELFEYIIGLDTACCFHFEVAADLFDERTLSLLATAPPGRIQFEAGLQSFYEPTLRAVSRKTNLEKSERNIKTLLQHQNIHIHVDLIAGLPHETMPDFQNSFDRAYALGAHTLQLGFLKLLHGSKLREQSDGLGIIYADEPPYEISCSPWLRADDLNVLKQTENALQPTYNKGRFLSALEYVLTVSKIHPFSLYNVLGEVAPNHGEHLDVYAKQVYDVCAELPGVNTDELRDRFICDWLGMVKGRNMPEFLKYPDRRRKQVAEKAEKLLGRRIGRGETAVLLSGKGVFVDSGDRDPVTGLYRLYFVDLE